MDTEEARISVNFAASWRVTVANSENLNRQSSAGIKLCRQKAIQKTQLTQFLFHLNLKNGKL